jgi:peptide/nickel transport system substrate-binding protein
LRTGEIDTAVRDVPPELRDEFNRLPGIKTITTAPLSVVELHLNYERAPFDRPEFRHAFSLMIRPRGDRGRGTSSAAAGPARRGSAIPIRRGRSRASPRRSTGRPR